MKRVTLGEPIKNSAFRALVNLTQNPKEPVPRGFVILASVHSLLHEPAELIRFSVSNHYGRESNISPQGYVLTPIHFSANSPFLRLTSLLG